MVPLGGEWEVEGGECVCESVEGVGAGPDMTFNQSGLSVWVT